ncbi:MAG: hypothetical protein ABI064_07285 [Acidobacteriaceae bacterium]
MNLSSPEKLMDADHPTATGVPLRAIDLDVRRSFRMHKKAALIVMAVVFLLLVILALSRKPYYQTASLIYVQPMKSKAITDVNEGSYDPVRYDAYIQQQFQTILRPDVLRAALAYPAARAWRGQHETLDAAAVRLRGSIKTERVEQSYEISIACAGNNAKSIADMCNALTDAYIHAERNDELAQSDAQLGILQQELDRVSTDLTNNRREQLALSVTLGLADPGAKEVSNPYDVQLAAVRAELGKATASHDIAVAQSQSASQEASNLHAAAEELASTDPALSAFKQSMGQRRSVLVSQMAGLTPKNPLYQQDQEELSKLDASLTGMETEVRNKISGQLQRKYDLESRRTGEIENHLRSQLDQMTQAATGATPQLQHVAELASEIERLQARYTVVAAAINAIQLDKDTSGLVHVIVPAPVPMFPKTSVTRLVLIMALPFAALCGLIAAILLGKLDPRVYIAEDVSRTLGFFPMATLPKDNEVSRKAKDEFILRLLAGIDQIHRTEDAQMFVFAGALTGDCVPELVASLARKMERLGYRVATITAQDLIENNDLSSGFHELTTALQPVITHENFVVAKIEAIKRDADFLFIEASPLLTSSEAEFATRLADVLVVVAESAITRRAELQQALSLAKRLRVPGAAVVLSQLSVDNADDIFANAVRAVQGRTIEAHD